MEKNGGTEEEPQGKGGGGVKRGLKMLQAHTGDWLQLQAASTGCCWILVLRFHMIQ